MQALEQQLQDRYPQWFRGERARLTKPLLRTVGRWSRLSDAEQLLNKHGHLRDFEFLQHTLSEMQVQYSVDAEQLASIPAVGRLLIVANHPSGALDAMVLLDAVGRVRRDVKIIANDVLSMIAPLSGLFLPVRVFGGKPSADSLRAIEQALEAEQCVIVFPAGEVSRLSLAGIRDTRWRHGFVRFAMRTCTPVLPVRIVARNSALFYSASAFYKPAATALLAREMFVRRNRPLRMHIGQPIRIDAQANPAQTMHEVRKLLYALGGRGDRVADRTVDNRGVDRSESLRESESPDESRYDYDDERAQAMQSHLGAMPQPIASPIDHASLIVSIAQTELLGKTADGKEIRLAQLAAESPLLMEIGRLRELTFREVGEGCGRSRDLDQYDLHYQHILVWDAAAGKIAGAYRVARGAQVLAADGLRGLYTASLFRYADEALPRIAQGVELGRSFVVPEYWGSRSLDYLWQGIGAYLRRYPQVRYLFGAVSISAALPLPAREQLVAYYSRYYGYPHENDRSSDHNDAAAASLRPFQYFSAPPSFGELDADTAYSVLKNNLAAHGASVPVLYKQYTELCEPGGARFLAFGVDPAFSDSIDGLIEVDLQRVLPKKRQRYLQRREATTA